MNTKITVDGVQITLTPEQLSEIDKQLNKRLTIDNIVDYPAACEVLNEPVLACTSLDKLKTIVRAANFIDNDYKPFKFKIDNKENRYFPYFKMAGGGWVFDDSDFFCCSYGGMVALQFKTRKSSDIIGKRFSDLWKEVLTNQD